MASPSRSDASLPVERLRNRLRPAAASPPSAPTRIATATRAWLREFWAEVGRARIVLAATALYWGVLAALGFAGAPMLTVYLRLVPVLLVAELVARYPVRLYDLMVRRGTPTARAAGRALRDAGSVVLGPGRVAAVATGILVVATIYGAFGAWKPHLIEFAEYRWDPLFDELDRWLHGGVRPWVLLHAVPHRDLVTWILDRNYYLWFPILGFTIAAHILTRDATARLRFLLAMVLLWAIPGTVLATIFASAGPPFIGAFVPGAAVHYAPLLHYLDGAGTMARVVQVGLWDATMGPAPPPFTGFSAMPSMHVAGSVLVALAAGRARLRILPWLAWLHVILTQLGSVYLGWHYAVDGYAALLLTPVIWWLSGVIIRRQGLRTAGDDATRPMPAPDRAGPRQRSVASRRAVAP